MTLQSSPSSGKSNNGFRFFSSKNYLIKRLQVDRLDLKNYIFHRLVEKSIKKVQDFIRSCNFHKTRRDSSFTEMLFIPGKLFFSSQLVFCVISFESLIHFLKIDASFRNSRKCLGQSFPSFFGSIDFLLLLSKWHRALFNLTDNCDTINKTCD